MLLLDEGELDLGRGSTVEPCQACSGVGSHRIWDVQLCNACAIDWTKDSPTYGAIEAKYGADANAAEVYRRYTRCWLELRRAKARLLAQNGVAA